MGNRGSSGQTSVNEDSAVKVVADKLRQLLKILKSLERCLHLALGQYKWSLTGKNPKAPGC